MPNAQRVGDPNTAGGIVTSGICGQPGCGIHCSAVTTMGSSNVRAGGLPIIRTGADLDNCGHARAGGSPNVRVN
jgi:uncharacterized Zn-binding protein involved in type VI secretion